MKSITTFLFTVIFTVTTFAQSGYKIGDTATDFSLMGTDEKMHSLADYKEAKGYVVIFTCNHCPFSVAYEDRIIALQTKYSSKGFPVIAINPNNPKSYPSDDFNNMKIRAKEKAFNFPYLLDKGQKIYPQYGATKTPHVFILDNKRTVQYIGAIDNSTKAKDVTEKFVETVLNELLEGKTPSIRNTKAIGCSIKN